MRALYFLLKRLPLPDPARLPEMPLPLGVESMVREEIQCKESRIFAKVVGRVFVRRDRVLFWRSSWRISRWVSNRNRARGFAKHDPRFNM